MIVADPKNLGARLNSGGGPVEDSVGERAPHVAITEETSLSVCASPSARVGPARGPKKSMLQPMRIEADLSRSGTHNTRLTRSHAPLSPQGCNLPLLSSGWKKKNLGVVHGT